MITDQLAEFVHGPVVSWVGTRNEQLRPSVSWVFGAKVDQENDRITIFVPNVEAEQTLSNLERNGLIAFTAANGISHEAYQFKGTFIEKRDSSDDDHAIQEIHMSKLETLFSGLYPDQFLSGYIRFPSTAITFHVTETFIQTPGPGAGDQIHSSSDTADK